MDGLEDLQQLWCGVVRFYRCWDGLFVDVDMHITMQADVLIASLSLEYEM